MVLVQGSSDAGDELDAWSLGARAYPVLFDINGFSSPVFPRMGAGAYVNGAAVRDADEHAYDRVAFIAAVGPDACEAKLW